jgi:hypothetical protein
LHQTSALGGACPPQSQSAELIGGFAVNEAGKLSCHLLGGAHAPPKFVIVIVTTACWFCGITVGVIVLVIAQSHALTTVNGAHDLLLAWLFGRLISLELLTVAQLV